MPWGNVVMIEHRLATGGYITSIYGHLDSNRRVSIGDIVQAGQCIGKIGRKSPAINGGYNPHLHFGIREGRMVNVGMGVFRLNNGGQPFDVKIAALDEQRVEVTLPADLGNRISFSISHAR
jgi:murein DD-endopeptidase MepM/ murein hydrolase activator NlpD